MLIQCTNLTKVYNEGLANETKALNNVTLSIQAGELCSIVGPSGSGKSTLLRIIGCLDIQTSGTYKISGSDTKALGDRKLSQIRNEQIGFVLQDFGLIEDRSVIENITLPLYFASKKKRKQRSNIDDLMSALGILELKKKAVSQLSGGQKQRVAIARALVNKPSLILADEPTGALDSTAAENVMSVFKSLNQNGTTIIIVTHNELVAKQCNRIITLSDGRII